MCRELRGAWAAWAGLSGGASLQWWHQRPWRSEQTLTAGAGPGSLSQREAASWLRVKQGWDTDRQHEDTYGLRQGPRAQETRGWGPAASEVSRDT